ncbi:uncharacterized protein EI90DRAFT_3018584 [Cantharellus anzutake]|uniref:uncharacterized protein n=1 Tax=Cantharellus anzutake TaxID=1750568 RepID=UPI001907B845|nr:uncharacterized protein EI90DRAFT_3018584 [Cantharellus anzutake]KAF8326650.1 hypothetical protein EI90DRAFT_3018584 [Cantharellus anzutake]
MARWIWIYMGSSELSNGPSGPSKAAVRPRAGPMATDSVWRHIRLPVAEVRKCPLSGMAESGLIDLSPRRRLGEEIRHLFPYADGDSGHSGSGAMHPMGPRNCIGYTTGVQGLGRRACTATPPEIVLWVVGMLALQPFHQLRRWWPLVQDFDFAVARLKEKIQILHPNRRHPGARDLTAVMVIHRERRDPDFSREDVRLGEVNE